MFDHTILTREVQLANKICMACELRSIEAAMKSLFKVTFRNFTNNHTQAIEKYKLESSIYKICMVCELKAAKKK